jgi:hypothetical protein
MFDIRLSEFNNCRSLESSRHQNSITVSDRPDSDHRQQPTGSDRIWLLIRSDLAKTAGIRPKQEEFSRNPAILARFDQICWPESDNGDKTLPDSGAICRTLIFAFVIFLSEPNARKYFRESYFFFK